MKNSLFLTLAFLPTILWADDLKTIYGKEYKDVTISRADVDGLIIVTDSGVEKIPFSYLPPEIQKKYGYDSQKHAAVIESQQRAAIAQAQVKAEMATKQKIIQGTVISNTRQGLLLEYEYRDERKEKKVIYYLVKQHPHAAELAIDSRIALAGIPTGTEFVQWKEAYVFLYVRDCTPEN